ncbi:phage tail protein [Embleya sp. NPDC059237]|uniref:phage tail tube protein n=1 Tax=Embleya sp. NPDC059237 TaxID=3346784 RepID=UPI0036CEEC6F
MSLVIPRDSDVTMVGTNGGGWTAPLGTAKPTSPLVTPPPPWAALGRLSEDGLVRGFDEDSTEFRSWGQTSPFRTIITKSSRTFKIACQEINRPAVMSLWNRIPEGSLTPDVNGLINFAETATPTPDRRAWWFVVLDGETFRGFYIPQGEISSREDETYKNDELAIYNMTITAYPDDAGNTVYHTIKAAVVDSPSS